MGPLKLLALFMVCLLLLRQVGSSPLPQQSSVQRRLRRMTPFWRSVSLRPIGASCRDNSECITRLCSLATEVIRTFQKDKFHFLPYEIPKLGKTIKRKRRCSLNGTQE